MSLYAKLPDKLDKCLSAVISYLFEIDIDPVQPVFESVPHKLGNDTGPALGAGKYIIHRKLRI